MVYRSRHLDRVSVETLQGLELLDGKFADSVTALRDLELGKVLDAVELLVITEVEIAVLLLTFFARQRHASLERQAAVGRKIDRDIVVFFTADAHADGIGHADLLRAD